MKATAESEKGFRPTPEATVAIAEMGKFSGELRKADILRTAEGLGVSSHGKRVGFDGVYRTVSDGPFAHPRELVAGIWLWEVKDMDEAVAWVKRSPNPMPEPCKIEMRPIAEGEEPQ